MKNALLKFLFYLRILFLQFRIKRNIKLLNNGGCGVFVSLFMKYHGDKFNCESVAYDDKDNENVKSNVKNKFGCDHHFIKSKWFLFDGYEFLEPQTEYKTYDISVLCEISQIRSNWSRTFDRNQIEKLEKIIKNF